MHQLHADASGPLGLRCIRTRDTRGAPPAVFLEEIYIPNDIICLPEDHGDVIQFHQALYVWLHHPSWCENKLREERQNVDAVDDFRRKRFYMGIHAQHNSILEKGFAQLDALYVIFERIQRFEAYAVVDHFDDEAIELQLPDGAACVKAVHRVPKHTIWKLN